MIGQLILFAVLAAICVVCALNVVLQENPVRSALFLVLVLFSMAVLFLTLYATFIAAVQIIVYAGAIMVLFIFVIMLLNLGTPEQIVDKLRPQRPFSFLAGLGVVAALAAVIAAVPVSGNALVPVAPVVGPEQIAAGLDYDAAHGVIRDGLFSANWLFPFEVVSILLLVAAIGAIMLAKKRI